MASTDESDNLTWEIIYDNLTIMWKLSLFNYRFSVKIIAYYRIMYNKQKNTCVLGNTRFISCVEHDISLVRCAHSWDIMFNTLNLLTTLNWFQYRQWIAITGGGEYETFHLLWGGILNIFRRFFWGGVPNIIVEWWNTVHPPVHILYDRSLR
jgi:hypothetical protein